MNIEEIEKYYEENIATITNWEQITESVEFVEEYLPKLIKIATDIKTAFKELED